jgi:hypothetical protein
VYMDIGAARMESAWKKKKEKKTQCITSSPLMADQMPAPPWEGQLMCTLFLSMHQ